MFNKVKITIIKKIHIQNTCDTQDYGEHTLVSIAFSAASIVLCCLISSTARFGPIPRKESQ